MNTKTINKIFLSLLILVLINLLTFSLPSKRVFAQDSTQDQDTETTEDTEDVEDEENTNENRFENREQNREEKLEKLQERKEAFEENKERIQERREEMVKKKCELVQDRVDNSIDRYTNNEGKYRERFMEMIEKIEELANRAEAAGYDVTELKNDLEALKSKVEDAAQLYSEYIRELSDTRSLICGQSEGEYKDAIKNSLERHKEVKTNFYSVRQSFIDEIKPDLKQLREQRQEKMMDTNSTTDENSESNN